MSLKERVILCFPKEAAQVTHMDSRLEGTVELLKAVNSVEDRGVIALLPSVCNVILVSSCLTFSWEVCTQK